MARIMPLRSRASIGSFGHQPLPPSPNQSSRTHVPLLRLVREQPEARADFRQAAGFSEDAEELLDALVGPLAAIHRRAVEGAKEAGERNTSLRGGRSG